MTDTVFKIYLSNRFGSHNIVYNDTWSPLSVYSREPGFTGTKPKGIMPVNRFSWAYSNVYGTEGNIPKVICTYSSDGYLRQEIMGCNLAALGATNSEFLRPDFNSFPPPPLSEGGATTKAYNKASSAGFDLLTEIGEGPETASMFYKAAVGVSSSLLSAYRSLRKKNIVANWREFKAFANGTMKASPDHWMAYRYGVRPVIGSVENFRDWYKNHHERNGGSEAARIIRGRQTSKSSTRTQRTSSKLLVNEGGIKSLMRFHSTQETIREIRVSCGIQERWVETNGIVLNPVTTAWELVPLSFVIDWFTTFGDQLTFASYRLSSMMREPAWVSHVSCNSQTTVISCVSEFGYAGHPKPPSVSVSGSYSGSLTIVHRSYNRRPGALPSLTARPDFFANISTAKIIDMLILIKQRIR